MIIVTEKATGLALYRFPDNGDVVITEKGLLGPGVKATDIKPLTHEVIAGVSDPPVWQGGILSWDGTWSITNQVAYDECVVVQFNCAKEAKQTEINSQFKASTALIKAGIAQEEIDTFGTQESEALAYQADNLATVPLLTGLAAVRNMTVSELAIRVLAHAAAYKTAMGEVMGKKHALEDQVKAALTVEELEKINVQ